MKNRTDRPQTQTTYSYHTVIHDISRFEATTVFHLPLNRFTDLCYLRERSAPYWACDITPRTRWVGGSVDDWNLGGTGWYLNLFTKAFLGSNLVVLTVVILCSCQTSGCSSSETQQAREAANSSRSFRSLLHQCLQRAFSIPP